MTTVKQVALTRLVPGAVVWAHIPFEECDQEKTRPAVVVDKSGRDVILRPC